MRRFTPSHGPSVSSRSARESRRVAALAAVLCVSLAGCRDKGEPPRREPPPPASEKPATCAGGGGKIADAVSAPFFPQALGGFCLDPNGGEKTFGDSAAQPIDRICDV